MRVAGAAFQMRLNQPFSLEEFRYSWRQWFRVLEKWRYENLSGAGEWHFMSRESFNYVNRRSFFWHFSTFNLMENVQQFQVNVILNYRVFPFSVRYYNYLLRNVDTLNHRFKKNPKTIPPICLTNPKKRLVIPVLEFTPIDIL
jgi:hypothetical protein